VVWKKVSIAEDHTDRLHVSSFCLFSIIILNENKRKCNRTRRRVSRTFAISRNGLYTGLQACGGQRQGGSI
jgi:hypothetical protein